MLEDKLSNLFGDDEPTRFGSGWWSGVLSAFFGVLAFGAVICLHFPGLLTSPDLRPFYPMPLMRLTIQALIVAGIGVDGNAVCVGLDVARRGERPNQRGS
jgi:hypothetical protein